jgi:hypothetical protein
MMRMSTCVQQRGPPHQLLLGSFGRMWGFWQALLLHAIISGKRQACHSAAIWRQ